MQTSCRGEVCFSVSAVKNDDNLCYRLLTGGRLVVTGWTISWCSSRKFLLLTWVFFLSVCRFIILACDGLFKVFSADEAVKFVLGVLQVRLSSFLFSSDRIYTRPPLLTSFRHAYFWDDTLLWSDEEDLTVTDCSDESCTKLLLLLNCVVSNTSSCHPPPPQEGSVEARPSITEEEPRFESACQQLASEAVRRGCADNVTVILVSIGF